VITHVFDLAVRMPAHLSVMYSMSGFGIPHGDLQREVAGRVKRLTSR